MDDPEGVGILGAKLDGVPHAPVCNAAEVEPAVVLLWGLTNAGMLPGGASQTLPFVVGTPQLVLGPFFLAAAEHGVPHPVASRLAEEGPLSPIADGGSLSLLFVGTPQFAVLEATAVVGFVPRTGLSSFVGLFLVLGV